MVLVVVLLGKTQCTFKPGEDPVFGVISTSDEVTEPLKAVALGYISGSSQNVPLGVVPPSDGARLDGSISGILIYLSHW